MTGPEREGTLPFAGEPPFEALPAGEVAIAVAGRWWAFGQPLGDPPPALLDLARRALVAGRPLLARHAGRAWRASGIVRPGPALVLQRAPSRRRCGDESRLATLVEQALARTPLPGASATSPSLLETGRILVRIAETRLPVLVLGETGTGKEVVARALHDASGRVGAFVAENCGALPEALVESELFGVRRGAYTGAAADRTGRLKQSSGGTLFLDEIGDLPAPAQAKLLRVLQEGEVRALGSTRTESVDIRVVAATHRDLRVLVEEGRFREDLYFRLAGFEVRLPPLRERRGDLPFLAAHLLGRLREEGSLVVGLSREAFEALASAPFRGNVRDLDNCLRRAAALAQGDTIEAKDLRLSAPEGSSREINLEARAILEALELAGGVKSDAARRLGWSRQKLYRRIARLGLVPQQPRIQSP